MDKYQLTPEAVSDLFEIWNFIAQDSPEAAERVETAVFQSFDLLASSPLAGRVRKDLAPSPLRFWVVLPYSKYLIVYDPEKKPLQIVRTLRSSRSPVGSGVTPRAGRVFRPITSGIRTSPLGLSERCAQVAPLLFRDALRAH